MSQSTNFDKANEPFAAKFVTKMPKAEHFVTATQQPLTLQIMREKRNNLIYLHDLLTNLEKELQSVNRQLEEAPAGRLAISRTAKRTNYYHEFQAGGKRKRLTVTSDEWSLHNLARKEYLLTEEKVLQKDIKLIRRIIDRYEEPDAANILGKLSPKLSELPEKLFFRGNGTELQDWVNEPYNQSDYRPEKKIHITSTGIRVRSKSELIIAEQLSKYRVAFRYEEILQLDNRRFVPDFTIKRKDGKLIYWEHCGLPNNSVYIARHNEKMKTYETAGIVPWKNLIVTYDEPDGTLNIKLIDSEIRNKILI